MGACYLDRIPAETGRFEIPADIKDIKRVLSPI